MTLPTKIIKTYYNPIINKFSKKSIENGEISFDTFIEWYEVFKKAYTSSKNIILVLEHLKSNLIVEFKDYVEKDGKMSNILYKQCIELGYKDKLKNMKEDMGKLNNKLSELSFNDSVDFCVNSKEKFLLVNNRIIILQILGCIYIDDLKKLQIHRNEQITFLREVSKNTGIRIKVVKEINEHFDNDICKIKKMSVNELAVRIGKYRHKRMIMKIIEYIIDNKSKINKITELLSYEYSHYNKVDFFFSSRPDDMLRILYDNVMEAHEYRLKKTSSYVDDRLKDFELRIVKFLEHLDLWIKKKIIFEKETDVKDQIILFFNTCKEDQIHNVLLDYGEKSKYDNSKVKSKLGKHHHAQHRLNSAISFLKKLEDNCECSNYIKTLKTSMFLSQIENQSELLDWDKRRVYTDDEVKSMLDEVQDNIKDLLMITILREIGLRNSAIRNLTLKDIVNDHKLPKHICRVKEKGNKIREFVTSKNIKTLIVTYIHKYEDVLDNFKDKYVFSRNKNLSVKMGSATLNSVLKRIAVKAGVTNVNVQAHTFRHTLVGKLMDSGNNIETVSKFIGHTSVDTTMTYYWLKNISDLSKEINNPFTQTILSPEEIKEEKDSDIEMLNKKIDTCFQIIGLYKEEIYKADSLETLKENLTKNKDEINKILEYIAGSVSGDTCSVYSSHIDVRT